MPNVRDVLGAKGRSVHSVSPAATVAEAVNKMNAHKIGALVVMHDEQVVGMFTERDVLRRIVGEGRPAAETTVGEVMTADVVCCSPGEELDEVAAIMKNRRIRHVPVCDGDGQRIVGMVSIGDLNAFHASTQEAHIQSLSDYIYGRS